MLNSSSPSPAPPPPNSIAAALKIPKIPEKKKRRPAGTPDPDAEVVSLSPKTLLESDRYVCEICKQGFQREQNLQMHRRRHKVPWKLVRREGGEAAAKKRVFVCPEPSCLHHHPSHALGDLVGIKKHFRRKHSTQRQWFCERCGKGYAVQSDYKAHLKTCGTRGHSCDCGRVFSRVESFIEHQEACNAGRALPELTTEAAYLRRTLSSPYQWNDANLSPSAALPDLLMPIPTTTCLPLTSNHSCSHELQLLPSSNPSPSTSDEARDTQLQLSIGPITADEPPSSNMRLKEAARDERRLAMAEKAMAEEARAEAKRQVELAEEEFANAKRIRQQAQEELNKAYLIRDHATKQINAILMQITWPDCRQPIQARPTFHTADEGSLAASHVSSVVTEGEGGDDDRSHEPKIPNA